MKHEMIVVAVVVLVSLGGVAMSEAQEQAAPAQAPAAAPVAPPTLTASEEASFAATRMAATLATAKAQDLKEAKEIAKLQAELKKVQAEFTVKRNALPEWRTYVAYRNALDGELARRGLGLNWETGAVTRLQQPAPAAPKK